MSDQRPFGTSVARLFAEGVVIVVSILLALAADAWWDTRQGQRVLDGQDALLLAQMTYNVATLQAESQYLETARAAEGTLVELISPDPQQIPEDSLRTLLGGVFNAEPRGLETSALLAALGSGELIQDDAGFQLLLQQFQRAARSYTNNSRVRLELREELISYLGNSMSLAAVSYTTAAHPASDFPIPVGDILSDRRLEGMIGNLAVRTMLLVDENEVLQDLAQSIVDRLDPSPPV